MKSDGILIIITIATVFLATIIIATSIPQQKEVLAQNTTIMANQTVQKQTATNQTQLGEGTVGEQRGGAGADNVISTVTTTNNLTTTTPATTTATPVANSSNNFSLYENSTHGIRAQYPSDWDLEETDFMANDGFIDIVEFYSPYQSRIDDYSESVWISKESNPVGDIALAEYADNVIDYYNASATDFNVVGLNTNNVTLSGIPAYKLVFTQSIEDVDVKTMEVGTITPKKEAYFITYYGEDSGQYSKYLPIVQKMIDSFEISNDTAIREESMERQPPTESFSSSQIRGGNNLSQMYEVTQGLFTLKYPRNWEASYKTTERSGIPILELTSPRDVSRIVVGLIEDFPLDPQDFESAFETSPRILQSILPNITIIKSDFGLYNIDGQKAGSVIYTLPLSSFGIPEFKGLNGNVKGLQIMVPLSDRTGRVLSITFATAENLFEKYLPIAESVINSTKINDSAPVPG
jgi:hypothetical protein